MIRKSLFRKGIIVLSSVFMMGILFTACKKNDDVVQPDLAALMAFNLSPDQQGVRVALSGNLLPGGPLSYSSFTGRYLNVYPGNRIVESFDASTNNTIDSSAYNFKADKFYSLFVVGANGNYKNIVTEDNYDSLTASSGKSYIRYINAIPDSSLATVKFTAGGNNLVNTTAAFGKVSSFIPVTPGDVNISVDNDGSVNANRSITVAGQKAYTVLIMGLPNQTDSLKAVQIKFIENGTVTD